MGDAPAHEGRENRSSQQHHGATAAASSTATSSAAAQSHLQEADWRQQSSAIISTPRRVVKLRQGKVRRNITASCCLLCSCPTVACSKRTTSTRCFSVVCC